MRIENRPFRAGLACLLLSAISLGACTRHLSDTAYPSKEIGPGYEFFKDEVKPAQSKPCFNGAYYRKIVSSTDVWLGISGRVILPTLFYDPSRINPAKPDQYLDNSSIYLGGNMEEQETDIGLIWEVIKDEKGNVSKERKAFRPFLRRTSHSGGQAAIYQNAPAESRYYWYPGEEVSMSVVVIADKKLRFVVEGAGKRFEQDFDCDGYRLNGKGEFKRVNAIDQVANEGKPVQPTSTRIENAVWKETNLFRMEGGKVISVPFHSQRYTDMRCPSPKNFNITSTQEGLKIGAESIGISGSGY